MSRPWLEKKLGGGGGGGGGGASLLCRYTLPLSTTFYSFARSLLSALYCHAGA